MQFTRLRLTGFKSFVEPCDLRIEPGLTGVVGPNGCGKSNLLEALRWVMGEGSPKSLRGGAMDDVIFAGTARRPARDRADVLLTLDNADRRAPAALNGDDVLEVVRRIERGAGSVYRVNGRDARQRDIQLLFADAATGAHSPALVSQGRIGQIIAAKPAERRLLLEEAAGIAGLHVRRHEAELRLRATEANLLRIDDLLAGLAAQANALRRAAKTADRYRALSAELTTVEARLLFARWTAANATVAAAQTAAADADAAVLGLAREATRAATAHAEAAAGLPDLRAAEAAAAGEVQRLTLAQAELAAELGRVEARRRETAAAAATLTRDRAREVALGDDARAALARLSAEAVALVAAQAAATAVGPALAGRVAAAEAGTAAAERDQAEEVEAHAKARAAVSALAEAAASSAAVAARSAADAARARRDHDALGSGDEITRRAEATGLALAKAMAAAEAASAAVDAAEAARRDRAAQRDAAHAALATARGDHAALVAEQAALTRALGTGDGAGGIVSRLTVAPGFEAALAAALGADVTAPVGAGPRYWGTTAFDADDPPLPGGVPALLDSVTAPPELTRRLRQIGVAADDAAAETLAARLRPGQRLVTRDGKLWRWDGFRVASADSSATADQLRRTARLAQIARALPTAAGRLEAATTAGTYAQAAAAQADAADRRARAARTAADHAIDAARTADAKAAASAAQFAMRREALTLTVARLDDDSARHARNAADARAAAAAAPDTAGLAVRLADARLVTERARTELAAARVAMAAQERELAAHTNRQAALATEHAGWEARARGSTAQLAELDARVAATAADVVLLDARPAAIAAEQARLAAARAQADAARRDAADALVTAEAQLRDLDRAARDLGDRTASAREDRARAQAAAGHAELQRREIEARCGERFATSPPRLPAAHGFDGQGGTDADALTVTLATLAADRDRLGPVNLQAAAELATLDATIAATTAERAELETAVARLRGSIGALNREGRTRLLAAFEAVDAHFRTLFGTLFAGGAAQLALVDADDALEAGLEIMAQPPGKKLQSLTLLSGGEAALTAIALIFALFLATPAPICVLDEVDAPLDDANVERFCDLLDHMAATTRTRFLIVTHNAVTMSRMHRLFGVTMAEPGVSQLVSVDLARAEHLLATG